MLGKGRMKVVGNGHEAGECAKIPFRRRGGDEASNGDSAVGNRDFFTGSDATEQARKLGFGFVGVYGLHKQRLD